MTKQAVWSCDICAKPAREGLLGVGAFCSARCKATLIKKARDHEHELLDEPLETMPDEFDVAAFDRFMLKLSLHMLRGLPPKVRAVWLKDNPLMLSASSLSLEIKGRVLKYIPLFYVSSMNAEGRERDYYGGTFMFKAKVPKQVLWDAIVKAKVMKARGEA